MSILENRFHLGFLPTPFQPLKGLSKIYPDYNIFIKRDDNTGLASGGNKTRKLEYLINEVLKEGNDTVITAGAQQSNHCRQTAAACAIAGLECHLMLGGAAPDHAEGNFLLSSLLGAEIHFAGENRKGENLGPLKKNLELKGKKCSIIPYGGSNIIGALGFVNAVQELKSQLIEGNTGIDYIFFASSSGGTQAGLILGLELFGLNATLIPINIDKSETMGITLEEVVFNLVRKGAGLLDIKRDFTQEDIQLNKDYDNAGYGVMTDREKLAIHQLARYEGIILDPVYTSRAFYGMLDFIIKKKIPKNSNILFWHTGGLPALFSYADLLN